MAVPDICGCWYSTRTPVSVQRHYFPQLELSSHTSINNISFTTSLSQTFVNPTSETIKRTRYTFPLYDGIAVTSFTCSVDDRIIIGRVEHKEQAVQTFDNAVEKGESAGLLESLPVGLFASTLGNIPAHATMVIKVTYGGELKHDAQLDGLRFCLPTSIAPRYGAHPGELLIPDCVFPSLGMRITVDVDMAGSTIRKIQSPSKDHAISISLGNLSTESRLSAPQASKASVTLAHGTVELATDFILQIFVDDLTSPRAILERHPILPNHQALMITFVPKFNLKPTTPEIVFVADQSSSMHGQKNASLIAAMTTFLKSLPLGVRFNICPFGSRHEFLWDESKPYTSETVASALAYIQKFRASFGGTQMYQAVEATFEKRLGDMPLEIVLLTDGEIYQEKEIFDLVHGKLHNEKIDARVFTLGIGNRVSTTLVEGLARAGRGFSQFVKEDELLDQKVVRMLKAALHPHISDFRLEPNYPDDADDFEIVEDDKHSAFAVEADFSNDTTEQTVVSMFDDSVDLDVPTPVQDRYAHLRELLVPDTLQTPHIGSPLFIFNRTTSFLLMEIESDKTMTSVTLHAKSSQGPLTLEIPVDTVAEGNTIHHLAVRKLVQELEEGRGWIMDSMLDGRKVSESSRSDEYMEREAVRLGLKYQVANKWCSFVAVEEGQVLAQPSQAEEAVPSKQNVFSRGSGNSRSGNVKKKRAPGAMRSRIAVHVPDDYSVYDDFADVDAGFGSLPPEPALPSVGVTNQPSPITSISSLTSHKSTMLQSSKAPQPTQPTMPRSTRGGGGGGALFGATARTYKVAEDLPTPQPPVSDLEKVRHIINKQTFAGYWEWDRDILSSHDIDVPGILTKMSAHGRKEDDATMTALVLRILRTKMAAFEGIWEMVAEKGEAWLDGEVSGEGKAALARLVEGVVGV